MPVNFLELFGMMVDRKISRLHLVPGSPIMMKIGDTFAPLESSGILSPQDTRQFCDILLNDQQKQLFSQKKELDFNYSVPGLSRFRINVFTQRSSIAAVIMMNPTNLPTIEELGLPEVLNAVVAKVKSGLILITGPKASGKSHTLAAIVNHILETRACQIVTIENPIDFLFRNKKGVICQREIGTDTDGYDAAFKSLLHQGADVLVLNEFNTYQIAHNALNLAASGMLVIATTQSPCVLVVFEQIIDLFPPHLRQQAHTLLSVSLEAVLSQHLLTRAHGGGLVPAFEICIGSPQVKNLLREGKIFQVQAVIGTTGREFGMQTQEQALRSLVKKNIITTEEALSVAVRPEEFKKLMSLPY